MAGVPFPKIMEQGRGLSETSLRTYLDVIGAVNLESQVNHLRATAIWLEEGFSKKFCLWPDAPPPHILERIASCGREPPGPLIRPLRIPQA